MMSLALVLPAVWSIQGEGHPLGHGLPPAVLQMNAKRASLSHHCQIAAACDRFEVLSVSIRPDSPFLANLELPIALLHRIAEKYCTGLNAELWEKCKLWHGKLILYNHHPGCCEGFALKGRCSCRAEAH